MEVRYLDEFNGFCSSCSSPFDIFNDGSVKDRLVELLEDLNLDSGQLGLFDSSEERVLDDLKELRGYKGALYSQWTQNGNGKKRNISVPCKPLARFISGYLVPLIKRTEIHDCCHGAEPGWSPKRSLETHLPLDRVLSFDLSGAFDNFVIGNIFDFYYKSLNGLEDYERRAIAGFFAMLSSVSLRGKRALPQGASHSSLVFNRGLKELDEELYEKSLERGFYYTRWTDDMTISSPEKRGVRDFLGAVELVGRSFPISYGKVFFQESSHPIYVLGQVIDRGRIFKNSKEDREREKVSPVDYDKWFGNGSYELWY